MSIKNAPSSTRRQTLYENKLHSFFKCPKFLFGKEYLGMNNDAKMLYILLSNRHELSEKNGWVDECGSIYIYFSREEMEKALGRSERTVKKALDALKEHCLIDEVRQGMMRPNKLYVLVPASFEQFDENGGNSGYGSLPVELTGHDPQNLRVMSLSNCGSLPLESTGHDPQNLRPSYTDKSYTDKSYTEGSITASAVGGSSVPFSQIMSMYNELCQTTGLRQIKSINGKRASSTGARFKDYGIDGFLNVFRKVSTSSFLCGHTQRGWKADFDWLIAPTNMQKVLEGKYDDDQCNVPHDTDRHDPFLEGAIEAYGTTSYYTE